MNNFVQDDPLGLDPLSPLPFRDPRWFVPAHGVGSSPDDELERAIDRDRPERRDPAAP